MKILKLSDKQFYKLQEFIEKTCDDINEVASQYIDSDTGNELIDYNKPLFNLQQKLNEVDNA